MPNVINSQTKIPSTSNSFLINYPVAKVMLPVVRECLVAKTVHQPSIK